MNRAQNNRKAGFTLVKITIALFMIGLMAAIAIPNFLRARANSKAKTRIGNLRKINPASDLFAMEKAKQPGSSFSLSADLKPYLKLEPSDHVLSCPAGGSYADQIIIGTSPVCSLGTLVTPAHLLPHR